jgi:hypothetical protein
MEFDGCVFVIAGICSQRYIVGPGRFDECVDGLEFDGRVANSYREEQIMVQLWHRWISAEYLKRRHHLNDGERLA